MITMIYAPGYLSLEQSQANIIRNRKSNERAQNNLRFHEKSNFRSADEIQYQVFMKKPIATSSKFWVEVSEFRDSNTCHLLIKSIIGLQADLPAADVDSDLIFLAPPIWV